MINIPKLSDKMRERLNNLKWDARFMSIAKEIATWSSCIRPGRQVGAIITRDRRILTTGYNGAPAHIKTCVERNECMRITKHIASGTCQEVCYAIHAEQNAILQAAKLGISIEGATLYCTHQPCSICAKQIINSGITRVVYAEGYPDEFAQTLLNEANISLEKFNIEFAQTKTMSIDEIDDYITNLYQGDEI